DAAKLSRAAKSDLDGLKSSLQTDLAALDADAITLSRVAPAVPFMPKLVKLIEDRIRIEEMNAQKTALTLTDVTSEIAQLRARLDAGVSGTGADALRLNKDQAAQGAQAVLALKAGLTEWFGFYNGYDPLFTWWIGVPFKKIDAALQDYATFLQDKVAAANLTVAEAAPQPIAPSAAPKVASVPDLNEIIGL